MGISAVALKWNLPGEVYDMHTAAAHSSVSMSDISQLTSRVLQSSQILNLRSAINLAGNFICVHNVLNAPREIKPAFHGER